MEYSNSSGTGRWSDWTRVVGAPVSAVSCLEKNDESPSVADIRRKRARGSVRSGICQAAPREWSE